MNKNNVPVIAIGIVLIALLVVIIVTTNTDGENKINFDGFAQCLASKNITMYGAEWCEHCKDEKAGFGNSFKYVSYVECTVETKKCIDNGIDSFPTWIFPNGKKLVGKQGVEKLSEESECPLPERAK
jgi:glutaredoxin